MTRKKVTFDVNPLLSGPSLESRTRSGSPFRFIPIEDIDVDPDQPRRLFKQEALEELSNSIREFGVLCPILVRVLGAGTYRLVSGERRLRASKLLGLDTIPAVIDTDEDSSESTLSKQLVENMQRQDLSPMEKAIAVGQLRDQFSLSVRDIAKKLGISKSQVQRSLDILSLPDDLQAALISGASESKVLMLKEIDDREQRRAVLEQLDELSRSELEAKIKGAGDSGVEVSHGGTAKKKPAKSLSLEDGRILEDIQRALGTKVQLVRNGRNPEKGKLVLEFYSAESFEDIYDRLVSS